MVEKSRVALLARPGDARDQLHRALSDLGASLVVEGDPADLDPRWVAEQSPTLIVVSLEPLVEAALDRFEALLAKPDIVVIYDDAEVTRQLEGWDLNRWARHFAAKLLGSDVVLPPSGHEERLTKPLSESLTESLAEPLSDEPIPQQYNDFNSLDIDAHGVDIHDIDVGININAGVNAESDVELDADVIALVAELEEFERNDQRQVARDLDFSTDFDPSFDQSFGHAGQKKNEPHLTQEHSIQEHSEKGFQVEERTPTSSSTPSSPAHFDFSNLSLMDIDGEPELVPSVSSEVSASIAKPPPLPETVTPKVMVRETMTLSLEPIESVESTVAPVTSTIASAINEKSNITASTPATIPGAVLILAGIGGPDAVRQLLSNLPVDLAVPVLLYQHLEVGNHERLVQQLAKVSRLPVQLSESGAIADPGKVNVLPSGLSIVAEGLQLRFVVGTLIELIEALPANESLLVMLSGVDLSLVETALSLRERGCRLLLQDPDSCFEPSAVQALLAHDITAYSVAELADHISAHWSLKLHGDLLRGDLL